MITDFAGAPVTSAEDLSKAVASHLPGEEIRIGVLRDQSALSIVVILGNRSKLAPMAGNREQDLDKVSAKLSRRRWSFQSGIQHDCAIARGIVEDSCWTFRDALLG